MSEPHVAAELEPRFLVTVTLDGDDDAQEQAEDFETALDVELGAMRDNGIIRAYTIERAP